MNAITSTGGRPVCMFTVALCLFSLSILNAQEILTLDAPVSGTTQDIDETGGQHVTQGDASKACVPQSGGRLLVSGPFIAYGETYNEIQQFDLATQVRTTLKTFAEHPGPIALGPEGALYVAVDAEERVYKIDPLTGDTMGILDIPLGPLVFFSGIVVKPDGNLLIAREGYGGIGQVDEYGPDGSHLRLWLGSTYMMMGLKLTPDGTIALLCCGHPGYGPNELVEYDPDGTNPRVVIDSTMGIWMYSFVFVSRTEVLVQDRGADPYPLWTRIKKYDWTTTPATFLGDFTAPPPAIPLWLARDERDGSIYGATHRGAEGCLYGWASDGTPLNGGQPFPDCYGEPLYASYLVVVNACNRPPTVEGGGPYTVNEGGTVELEASGQDPDGGNVAFAWDLDGDGIFEVDGANVVFNAAGLDGPSSHGVRVRASDDGGLVDTDEVVVEVRNAPPVADAGADVSGWESMPVTLLGSATDPGTTDILSFEWDFDYDGIDFNVDAVGRTGSTCWSDDWVGEVALRVTDDDGAWSIDVIRVAIINVPPVAEAGAGQAVNEGDAVSFSGSATDESSEDVLAYAWDFDDGSTTSGTLMPTHVYGDDGIFSVTLTVSDDDGGAGSDTCEIVVKNVGPSVGPIAAPRDPVAVGTKISANSPFTDAGFLDSHTAVWSWGDGSASAGMVTECHGSGSVSGLHAYASPGVYAVELAVTDDDGDSGEAIYQYIVVYDPSGSFVTGGGWIDSPAGAYVASPALSGKATFGFVARYQKGATVPTGQTHVQFKVADLNFHSSSYEWLVVAGGKAMYKGAGTIDGEGNYGFMVHAIDGHVQGGGGTDRLRIKIWERATETLVYDNQLGAGEDADPTTALGGGSIVIHRY